MSTPGFEPLPENEPLVAAWPTPNRHLFDQPELFFARTRANPEYGKPGWTRECGKRFHTGCDIAPVNVSPTGRTTILRFTDCDSGQEYDSEEPTFIPHDPVRGIASGHVREVCRIAGQSDYGKHVVIQHTWPRCRVPFFSLYAHLETVEVQEGGLLAAGAGLGTMGQTSRIADARNWMAATPHLHFEVWNAVRKPYNPEEFLRRFLPRPSTQ